MLVFVVNGKPQKRRHVPRQDVNNSRVITRQDRSVQTNPPLPALAAQGHRRPMDTRVHPAPIGALALAAHAYSIHVRFRRPSSFALGVSRSILNMGASLVTVPLGPGILRGRSAGVPMTADVFLPPRNLSCASTLVAPLQN